MNEFYGTAAADVFDVIAWQFGGQKFLDFDPAQDVIRVSGDSDDPAPAFEDLKIKQVGTDTVVSWDLFGTELSMTLVDTQANDISQSNFTFIDHLELYGKHSANDVLEGRAGDDSLYGLSGDDTLFGRGGNDTIEGGDGDDRIFGQSGEDTLNGGKGNDELIGGKGADILDGGLGVDTVSYTESPSGVDVNLLITANSLVQQGRGGHAEGDKYIGIENVVGSRFADKIIGNIGDNVLSGGEGDDFLHGSYGNDVLIGGEGEDTFHFHAHSFGGDTIRDFEIGVDIISIVGDQDDYAPRFEELEILQEGDNAVVTWLAPGNIEHTLTLEGVDHTQLSENSFHIANEFDIA